MPWERAGQVWFSVCLFVFVSHLEVLTWDSIDTSEAQSLPQSHLWV